METVRRSLRQLEPRSVAAVLLLAGGMAAATVYVVQEQWYRTRGITDNHLIVSTERLLSALKDVETGERGYVISGLDEYLGPYRDGLAAVSDALRGLSAGSNAGELPGLVAAKLDVAARVVAIRTAEGSAPARAAMLASGDRATMDRVRSAVAALQSATERRMRSDSAAERRWSPVLLTGAIIATLLGFASVALLAWRRRQSDLAGRAMLTAVLDNAPVGLGFLNPALEVRHMNRALSTINERVLGAETGGSLWDVLPEMRVNLEPRLRQVLESGRIIRDVEVAAESRIHPGQVREYLFSFFPLPRVGGQPGTDGAGLVVSDVTIRKRVERRVRENEERFRILTKASSAIIWLTPASGAFEHPQPAWTSFTGQGADALTGAGWLDAVHPDDRVMLLGTWQAAIAEGTPFTAEHRLRRADGEWRTMFVRGVPVLDEAGAVREWVGTHTDITEARQAETDLRAAKEEAEAANRAKSQFLANMSHELRTPLSAVIGYSEMLEEEMQDLGQTAMLGDVKKINSNARHLLSLINDVLDISKIEAEKMTTFAENFDVADLMRDVSSTVQALVAKKSNTLVLDLQDPAAMGCMHTDQVKLRQCLFNLIGNAAKFTEDGVITVKVRREADTVVFAVADNGIGMSPEQLKRLFERFAQADASTTRRFGGTGLGLAITRAFCRLLGGDVSVESIEGQGSTFTMWLPAILPDVGSAPAETPGVTETTTGRHLALVIDDDPAQRDLLTRFLEREGFDVRCAADGKTGLALARSLHPRAILLDVMMPQMDGWSVLTALKDDQELAGIPVVMITFVNEPALGAALGAAELIPKPVDWERLKHVMERFQSTGAVLVVDDDDDARARVRAALESVGMSVSEARNGMEALAEVSRTVPGLILLDLTMPVMDGFTFLHELRTRPGCRNVPVVVLTARDLSGDDRQRLVRADRVVSKGDVSLRELAGQVLTLANRPPVSNTDNHASVAG